METNIDTTIATTETTGPTAAEMRFNHQVENLESYADNIRRLLEFIATNKEKLEGLNWTASHIYGQIEIEIGGYLTDTFEQNTRVIARRWPGRVWKRVKNEMTCGVLDWLSEPTGEIPVRIRGAEHIQWLPAPNTEVLP